MISFAISASAAILVVLTIRWALKGRVAPGWISALWLVAITRMLMPVTPESPLSVLHWANEASKAVGNGASDATVWGLDQTEPKPAYESALDETIETPRPAPTVAMSSTPAPSAAPSSTTAPPLAAAPSVTPDPLNTKALPETEERPAAALAPSPAPPQQARSFAQIAFWVWLIGACAVIGLACIRALLTARSLGVAKRLDDPVVDEILANCKAETGVRRGVRLFVDDSLSAPAVVGTLRPRILIPSKSLDTYSARDLRHIFLHELAHVRRCDGMVAWLSEIAVALHWFNPLAWLARKMQRADRELACDEFALRHLGGDAERRYGETLLKVATGLGATRSQPALSMARQAGEISSRVRRIASRRRVGRWRHPAAALALIAAAAIGATSAPGKKPTKPFPDDSKLTDLQSRLQVTVIGVPPDQGSPLLLSDDSDTALLNTLVGLVETEVGEIETTISAISEGDARSKTERGRLMLETTEYFLVEGAIEAIPISRSERFHGTTLEFAPTDIRPTRSPAERCSSATHCKPPSSRTTAKSCRLPTAWSTKRWSSPTTLRSARSSASSSRTSLSSSGPPDQTLARAATTESTSSSPISMEERPPRRRLQPRRGLPNPHVRTRRSD